MLDLVRDSQLFVDDELLEDLSTLHIPDNEDLDLLEERSDSYIRGWNRVKRRMASLRRERNHG